MPFVTPFTDRADAGRQLARRLAHLRGEDVVVLGLPRGGVPVAAEVAAALDADLDVIVVRKLGVPFQPELGMGAVGEGGVRVVNRDIVRMAGVTDDDLAAVEAIERAEVQRRARRFRGDRPRVPLEGRTAVVVDDGIATGSTARAACQVARALGARRVVLAVPVAPRGWEARIGTDADEAIALRTPEDFFAIGQFYVDFAQTPDEEVTAALDRARRRRAARAAEPVVDADPPPPDPDHRTQAGTDPAPAHPSDAGRAAGVAADEDVAVDAGTVELAGHLTVPDGASGLVVFAHGSGSSRLSPRNRFVARVLHDAGLGTLLFDLLTPTEELDRANVFDVVLLADRLGGATRWVRDQAVSHGLRIGYFGASTGAAAALWAAAEPGADVAAVVSRGGRPDLAAARLPAVRAPTLLVVGGRDEVVIELNRRAQAQLRCTNRLAVVPGATHLFEEPGTLQAAASLARDWFATYLRPATRPTR